MSVNRGFFLQLFLSVPVGVGQVYGCDSPWTGGLILLALLLSSPAICFHAMLGSAAGVLSGKKDSPICIEICIMSSEATAGSFGSSKGTVALWWMNHDMFSFFPFQRGLYILCVCWLNFQICAVVCCLIKHFMADIVLPSSDVCCRICLGSSSQGHLLRPVGI